ncbi:retrovirus-related Pol polyprotein from transposon 17.6 [Trichonephila clavata]|uniref:Retrovirus-related Pol polyprotein from transposon 17.6 n=1 Tax=Trichonephila clavata TaxID=2740835 RepID=A0A8X6L2A2_TRICU|nr:retrovirus-related Pol polyprotein from transposon 17.6 [Trichonephila clavata]
MVWNDKYNESFKMLKVKLFEKPVLHAPDFSKPFILRTDASDQGYVVVLTQKDDKEHTILFFIKKFTAAVRKYSTTEKECAAILYTIKELKRYIDGQTGFYIHTDHKRLIPLKINAGSNG